MRENTFIRLIAPALALLLFAGAALAQTQVKLRAGAHDGFGRVVFDLPGRLAHKAVVSGQVLRIDFEQPIAVGLEPVRRHLFRYVREAKLENDGRRISVSLLKPVTLREQWIENALVVDLVDVKADGGLNRPRVSVRSGDHSDYSRLVFDWRRHTDYRVQQDGRSVAVTFGADARLDVAAIAADRPDRLAGIEVLTPDNGSAVRLSVANDARIRHFRSGTKVVVDILGKPPGDSRQAVETNAGTAKSKPKPSASKLATAPVPAAKAPRSLLASSDEKEAANDAGDGKPAKSEGSAKPGAPQSATANAASVESSDTAKDEAKAKPAPRRFSSRSDGLELAVDRSGETIFLSFAWPEPVPAAVFERAGYLWLVFDQPAEPDLDALRPSDGIVRAQQIRDSRATILRLKTRDDLFPSIRRKGAIWILSLSDRSGGAKSSVPAVSQPNAEGGARVFLPVSDTGKRLAIYDPEVGDELLVVPLLGDGVGVAVAQRFVQFELLASLQGLAFRPNADDVIVRPLRNGVAIGADSGLLLSSQDSKRRTNDAQPYRSSLKSPITHFIAWQGGRGANFGARKQELQQIQAKSPAAGRNVARWEMAKFYIGHGLAAETWALLQLIEKDDAGAAQNPQYRAVRGITKLLMNRLDEARDDLMHADLKLYPDVALWRGDLLLRLGDAEEARAQFALGSGILPVLPSKLRERILRQWAVAAVEAGDDPGFHQAEDELKRLPPNKRIQTTLSYLNGRIAAREGDDEAALAAYDEAIAADFRPFRARAAFERVNSALKSGKIDPAQAVERLDSLRFAWRGDDFELDVLNRIVDIELELDRYASALGHLREAISYFPESEATKAMARQMNEIFVDLFLEGKADDMPPVSALALYYEFQELTPIGSNGDKMIQRLADRLANIDLLGRAAKLLEHQVTYRLRGRQKSRIGARLAVIYLLDAKPAAAIDALQRTRGAALPPALEAERRYLEARALADLGRSDEALALLGEDDSGAAELLRADIFWRGRRWSEAAQTAQALLGERWRNESELSPREQTQVVQIAVSLYMSDNIDRLRALQRQYGDKMRDGPHAETFRLLTQKVDLSKTEFRKLAGEIARTAELEAFMTNYRDMVKSGGLSALN